MIHACSDSAGTDVKNVGAPDFVNRHFRNRSFVAGKRGSFETATKENDSRESEQMSERRPPASMMQEMRGSDDVTHAQRVRVKLQSQSETLCTQLMAFSGGTSFQIFQTDVEEFVENPRRQIP